MPLQGPIERAHRGAHRLPMWFRYTSTLGMVGLAFAARLGLEQFSVDGAGPFALFFPAILAAAAVFGNGAGYLATAAAALAGTYFLPPVGEFSVASGPGALTLGMFVGAGGLTATVVETLHNALRRLRKAVAEREAALAQRAHAEAERALLLEEFRHRSRNDLQSLVGLLLLRSKGAPPEAKHALREAAGHALGLARVHSRLAIASAARSGAVIDAGHFVRGMCKDLLCGTAGDGLRPIALHVEAETHTISTERAVQLGLVLNECVTNALKYGFPDDMAGSVRVWFRREGEAFALTVHDDGIGVEQPGAIVSPGDRPPAGAGLGTRLLRALAAQLRGTFSRQPGADGGTCCELRFPVPEPGNPPATTGR